jgi:hypothetical protein
MRPAADSILSAVERTDVGEDRLTEVLACVAHVNQHFAAALVSMAGIEPRRGERYAVGTQRLTPGGRRVDMEIATYRGLARKGLVWIEVKAGAVYQPNQLRDYAQQVRDHVYGEPDGRVLTIIPPNAAPEAAPAPLRWESKTWSEVAIAADRLGRDWGRAMWRGAAMQPSAPAQWRYLAELVRRLEEKEYARMEPLTPEDVVAAQRVLTLPKTIEDLVEAASTAIDGVERGKWSAPRGGCYRLFAPTEPKWFSDIDRFGSAYPELLYSHEEDWTPEQLGAPAFCAGVTFNEIADATRHALRDADWQAQLPDGVSVGGSGRLLRVARTKYLSELIVAGGTFDEQLQALTIWANRAMTDIMDSDKVKAPNRRLDPSG